MKCSEVMSKYSDKGILPKARIKAVDLILWALGKNEEIANVLY